MATTATFHARDSCRPCPHSSDHNSTSSLWSGLQPGQNFLDLKFLNVPPPVLEKMAEEKVFYQPNPAVAARAHVRSHEEYKEMYQRSIDDPDGFWSEIADQFYWKSRSTSKHTENLDCRNGRVSVEWLKGSTTNVCYNMLDRHVQAGRGDKVAFYWSVARSHSHPFNYTLSQFVQSCTLHPFSRDSCSCILAW